MYEKPETLPKKAGYLTPAVPNLWGRGRWLLHTAVEVIPLRGIQNIVRQGNLTDLGCC